MSSNFPYPNAFSPFSPPAFSGFAQPRVVGWEGERKPPVAQGFRAGWARRDPFGQKLSESGGENEKNEAADVVVPRSGAEDEACF